jgi:hypothetical protein
MWLTLILIIGGCIIGGGRVAKIWLTMFAILGVFIFALMVDTQCLSGRDNHYQQFWNNVCQSSIISFIK